MSHPRSGATPAEGKPLLPVALLPALALGFVGMGCQEAVNSKLEPPKLLVAHRGASAYAPEHTREAYLLAIEQGADLVEQDLQITRDGVLVCLHDLTLERTTNVREVFPDRYREETHNGVITRHWYVSEFTLEEIRSLDAGSWFDPRFQGAKIVTFSEAISEIRGKAGLFPELKSPEFYRARGFDMERLLVEELERHGLHEPGADPQTPIIIQSFNAESLRRLAFELESRLPLVLLVSQEEQERWLTPEGLAKVREFASGIGPNKNLVDLNPRVVRWSRELGLTVTPWTFRSGATGRFSSVGEEMAYFLYELGADAVFTDNPDQFPRGVPSP